MLIPSGLEKELGRRGLKSFSFACGQEGDPHEGKEGNPCHAVPSDFIVVGLLELPVGIQIVGDEVASRSAESRKKKAADQ